MSNVVWQRNFALFWCAGLISSLGDKVLFVALPFAIYLETGSISATGTMFIVESIPGLLFGAFAGVVADRKNRQHTLVTADLLRAILLLPLLFAHSASTIWLVYPIAFSAQAVGQFFTPAAGALLPRLVAKEDLPTANAWFSFGGSFTLLAGPSLGGFLLGVAGWSSIIVVDSSSFALSAVLIGCVSLPADQPASGTLWHPNQTARLYSYWHDWVVGLRIVARSPMLLVLFAVSGLVTVAGGGFVVMIVPYVRQVLHGQAQLLGLLASAQGGGGIVGGLLFVRLAGRIPPLRVLVFGFGMMGIALLICFNSTVLAVVVSLWVLVGLLLAATGIAEQTLLQRTTVDAIRGCILGTLGTTNALAGLMGMSIASVVGFRVGTLPILDTMAGLSLLAGALCLGVAWSASRPASAPCAPGREEAHGTLSR